MPAPSVTIVGNLTADPELRFTPSGAAVANFTVVSNDRFLKDGEWQDKDPVFIRCNVWREYAENVAESLQRGNTVIVTGKLSQREWEDRDGNKRVAVELEVDEIGPALRFATAKVTKAGKQAKASDSGW